MSTATCKTCPWSDRYSITDAYLDKHPNTSVCRALPPTPDCNDIATWPLITDVRKDWCGYHPERKTEAPRSECERLGYHVCGVRP